MYLGINLGTLAVGLCEDKYQIEAGRVEKHTQTMEESQKQFSNLTTLLTEMNIARQKDKNFLDLSEHRELVDSARSYSSSLAKILPEGVYEWNTEDSIKILSDTMTQESKRIATVVNPEMMYINQGLQDIGELVKVFSKILEILSREGHTYVNNQTKR